MSALMLTGPAWCIMNLHLGPLGDVTAAPETLVKSTMCLNVRMYSPLNFKIHGVCVGDSASKTGEGISALKGLSMHRGLGSLLWWWGSMEVISRVLTGHAFDYRVCSGSTFQCISAPISRSFTCI